MKELFKKNFGSVFIGMLLGFNIYNFATIEAKIYPFLIIILCFVVAGIDMYINYLNYKRENS